MATAQLASETPCFYCDNRECDQCIHAVGGPAVEDVRKGLVLLRGLRAAKQIADGHGVKLPFVPVPLSELL